MVCSEQGVRWSHLTPCSECNPLIFVYSIICRILEFFRTNAERYSVVFTSGATESIRRVGEWFNYCPGGELCYLQDNHTSVLGVREYALQRGASVRCVTEDALTSSLSEENGKYCFGCKCRWIVFQPPKIWEMCKYAGWKISKYLFCIEGSICKMPW